MKRVQKGIALLLVLILAMAVFTACGEEKQQDATATEAQQSNTNAEEQAVRQTVTNVLEDARRMDFKDMMKNVDADDKAKKELEELDEQITAIGKQFGGVDVLSWFTPYTKATSYQIDKVEVQGDTATVTASVDSIPMSKVIDKIDEIDNDLRTNFEKNLKYFEKAGYSRDDLKKIALNKDVKATDVAIAKTISCVLEEEYKPESFTKEHKETQYHLSKKDGTWKISDVDGKAFSLD